jgi:hypothetical protein
MSGISYDAITQTAKIIFNKYQFPPPRFIGVFGLLFLNAPNFSSGLSTWNEQVKSYSIRIMAPLLLNYPQ